MDEVFSSSGVLIRVSSNIALCLQPSLFVCLSHENRFSICPWISIKHSACLLLAAVLSLASLLLYLTLPTLPLSYLFYYQRHFSSPVHTHIFSILSRTNTQFHILFCSEREREGGGGVCSSIWPVSLQR